MLSRRLSDVLLNFKITLIGSYHHHQLLYHRHGTLRSIIRVMMKGLTAAPNSFADAIPMQLLPFCALYCEHLLGIQSSIWVKLVSLVLITPICSTRGFNQFRDKKFSYHTTNFY